MLKRLVKDESGIAMGLAIITMVLVGVMGAGLLVFVRNDLEAVVEVNQGQRAFSVADAGTQAAKQHLLGDKTPAHYDVDNSSNSLYYTASCNVSESDESAAAALQGPSWSPEGGGVTRNFSDGRFNVTIRWLSPNSSNDGCKVPEPVPLPEGVDYFKVISTGTYGNATRRIETIYSTYDLNVPKGYFTPGRITIAGSACIDSVSLFTLDNVTLSGGGNGCDGTGQNIKGTDKAYGNWQNSINPTPRSTDAAGIGAAGTIDSSLKVSGRDYDKNTCPKLVQDLTSPSTCSSPEKITFPFTPSSQPDMDFLRDEAMRQEQENTATQRHYYNPGNGNFSLSNWPDNSSENTIVFVEFSGTGSSNTVKWDVSGSCTDNPPKKGTLVVRNGNFTTQPNRARFQGVVIVRGGQVGDETADGASSDTGKTCLEGFVNAQGEIKIAGNVTPFASDELANNRPGFYGIRTWSWRELYQ